MLMDCDGGVPDNVPWALDIENPKEQTGGEAEKETLMETPRSHPPAGLVGLEFHFSFFSPHESSYPQKPSPHGLSHQERRRVLRMQAVP